MQQIRHNYYSDTSGSSSSPKSSPSQSPTISPSNSPTKSDVESSTSYSSTSSSSTPSSTSSSTSDSISSVSSSVSSTSKNTEKFPSSKNSFAAKRSVSCKKRAAPLTSKRHSKPKQPKTTKRTKPHPEMESDIKIKREEFNPTPISDRPLTHFFEIKDLTTKGVGVHLRDVILSKLDTKYKVFSKIIDKDINGPKLLGILRDKDFDIITSDDQTISVLMAWRSKLDVVKPEPLDGYSHPHNKCAQLDKVRASQKKRNKMSSFMGMDKQKPSHVSCKYYVRGCRKLLKSVAGRKTHHKCCMYRWDAQNLAELLALRLDDTEEKRKMTGILRRHQKTGRFFVSLKDHQDAVDQKVKDALKQRTNASKCHREVFLQLVAEATTGNITIPMTDIDV